MMKAEPIGLYIHIPFCIKKCNYCDFCSFPEPEYNLRNEYINALAEEILSYKRVPKIQIDTLFFGGGTPSLLTPEEFSKICNSVHESFEVLEDAEITVEVNPKTLTPQKIKAFVDNRVNRISIGLQTIHNNEYKMLGRIHDFEDFKVAYAMIKDAGISNINIDVMYGIPEQTHESFRQTLEAVLSFKPSHISMYGLILEEGTPLYGMRDSIIFPSEDAECEMYELGTKLLAEHGYIHYEISNYARPGFESRHNLKYWENKEYIGVGLSAYSFFENKRYGNADSPAEYSAHSVRNYIYEENITPQISAYEYVMLGLRLSKGISLSDYKRLYGVDFLDGREAKIKLYISEGYMSLECERLFLTERGFYVSNAILAELI